MIGLFMCLLGLSYIVSNRDGFDILIESSFSKFVFGIILVISGLFFFGHSKYNKYLKSIVINTFEPKNIAKYLLLTFFGVVLAWTFQYAIVQHPNLEVTFNDTGNSVVDIKILNNGNAASENTELRLLYQDDCNVSADVAEFNYLFNNMDKYHGKTSVDDNIYKRKLILSGFKLNPGTYFTIECPKNEKMSIQLTGSNLNKITRTYP